ncbi:MAG: hypothetical protein H6621_06920 [Halobacteriovoraceae bacterium]|nr:hypothetical protein [Halobacteriovoraceae bacterium]
MKTTRLLALSLLILGAFSSCSTLRQNRSASYWEKFQTRFPPAAIKSQRDNVDRL